MAGGKGLGVGLAAACEPVMERVPSSQKTQACCGMLRREVDSLEFRTVSVPVAPQQVFVYSTVPSDPLAFSA